MADWPVTVNSFGDVHYFYSPPTSKPPHHRFDKGSYVYLFENANDRRARIEIANQPGTEEQDAFDGFLDKTHVRYSYNHQCMVTLIVGETTDQMEWHLPTYDPQNQNKYHYKLHSLDIYFWKPEDALQFVNGIRFVLPPSQVEILDEPQQQQQQQQQQHHQVHQPAPVSSVVQQLEHVAISDPNYGTPNTTSHTAPPSFPGPPPTSAVQAPEQQQQPASFVPMAYNPAAPAAPETIRHREKTPPPEDGPIDPLAAAVAYDAQAPFSPGFVPPPGFQSAQGIGIGGAGLPPPPPPPQQQFGGPPAQPGLHRAVTMPVQAVHNGLASPGLTNPYGSPFPTSPGFQPPPPPPPQQQHTTPPAQQASQPAPPPSSTPQATPPITNPGPPATPTAAAPPVAPPGGFSQYSYTSSNGTATPQQQQQQPGAFDYSIHAQAYRPTEMEANKYKGYAGKQDPSGKLEQNMGRLEKGVTGMFRKFEKKFG
ncbi:RNA recognition motif-containing protein [Colletotrichum tofieldiae]|nr:RNA recognition motif-containing protein [Colletotrichum tofieldiae]GKT75058.1 RNA recognition motif-containing protein [Colletotrichum tofieldiae]